MQFIKHLLCRRPNTGCFPKEKHEHLGKYFVWYKQFLEIIIICFSFGNEVDTLAMETEQQCPETWANIQEKVA